MKQLGLDLSTSVCGWSISEDNEIVGCGFFDIKKANSYKEKAKIIIKGLEKRKFDQIVVEETLSGFMFGRTSQQTILKLAKNKAVICYILEEYYEKDIIYANASTMRKQLFGKSRIKGVKSKDFVREELEKLYNLKGFIRYNKRGGVDKKMEDVFDAIVCSLYKT